MPVSTSRGQVFHRPHAHIVAEQHGFGGEQLSEHFKQGILLGFHTRRGDLSAEYVAVAVEHEAGQPVAFAVAQAVKGHVEQRFAQLQSPFKAFLMRAASSGSSALRLTMRAAMSEAGLT